MMGAKKILNHLINEETQLDGFFTSSNTEVLPKLYIRIKNSDTSYTLGIQDVHCYHLDFLKKQSQDITVGIFEIESSDWKDKFNKKFSLEYFDKPLKHYLINLTSVSIQTLSNNEILTWDYFLEWYRDENIYKKFL
jgi:hypothetical protein